jgi:hypothetical protein
MIKWRVFEEASASDYETALNWAQSKGWTIQQINCDVYCSKFIITAVKEELDEVPHKPIGEKPNDRRNSSKDNNPRGRGRGSPRSTKATKRNVSK